MMTMLLQKLFMNKWLCLIVGGSLGTIGRYLLSQWLNQPYPYGTLSANVVGCLLLGLILGILEGRVSASHEQTQLVMGIPLVQFLSQIRLLLLTGFLGALTTFSAMEMEAFLMAREQNWLAAFGYLLMSLVMGFVAIWFTYSWARWCFGEMKWN